MGKFAFDCGWFKLNLFVILMIAQAKTYHWSFIFETRKRIGKP